MTMRHHRAASVVEAVELLAELGESAHLVSGGTSVNLMMKLGFLDVEHLVSLRRLDELQGVDVDDDGTCVLGAASTIGALERSAAVAGFCPALARTFSKVATPRVRNQATIGGNLAHADPTQDPPPMLIALDARVALQGPGGRREVPVEELATGFFETVIAPGEVLTAVHVPPPPLGSVVGYRKFVPGTADALGTVTVAASLAIDPVTDHISHARVALGCVGSTALRAPSVEVALGGARSLDEVVEAAAEVVRDISPYDDERGSAGYKEAMARVWTGRLLRDLVAEARGGGR